MRRLFWRSGYLVSSVAAVSVPLALISNAMSDQALPMLAMATGAYFAVMFATMVFSRQLQEGVRRANRELQGDQPFRFRRVRLFDPHWGVFGDRLGDPFLGLLRVILLGEVAVSAIAFGVPSYGFFLATGGFGVAMLLTHRHAALASFTNEDNVRGQVRPNR